MSVVGGGRGVMEMGNIELRAVIKPTFVAFEANMLTITPPRLPDVATGKEIYRQDSRGRLL